MYINGTRHFKVNLDQEHAVHDLGFFARSDVNEVGFAIELIKDGEIVNCSDMSLECRIIFNPKSAARETFAWTGTCNHDGIWFFFPEAAHEKTGLFVLYATVTDSRNSVHTVFYGQGTLIEKEGGTVYVPKDELSLDTVQYYLQAIQDATSRANALVDTWETVDNAQWAQINALTGAIGQQSATIDAIHSVDERQDSQLNKLMPDVATLQSSDEQQWTQVNALTGAVEQHTTEIDGLRTVDTRQDDQIDRLQHKVVNLDMAAAGYLYRLETDERMAYGKIVPEDAMPYASVDRIGGRTITWNVLPRTCTGRTLGNGIIVSNVRGNTWHLSGTTTVATDSYLYGTEVEWQSGHVYYSRVYCQNDISQVVSLHMGTILTPDILNNGYVFTKKPNVYFVFNAKDVGKSIDTDITWMLLDLTVMFGAEAAETMTAEQVDAMFPAGSYENADPIELNMSPDKMIIYPADTAAPPEVIDLAGVVAKYFPDGMKSDANGWDELDIERGVAVKRANVSTVIETRMDEEDLKKIRDVRVEGGGVIVIANQHGNNYSVPLPSKITYVIKL